MAGINTVLFDIYGTLIDIHTDEHRDDIFEALSRFLGYRRVFISGQALKELYFSELNQQFARSRERHPEVDVAAAFERALRDHGRMADRYLTMIVAQLYRSLTRGRFGLFPDTFWTLTKFRKDFKMGIVTDAQRLYCKPELRTLRIEDFFDALAISSDYGFRKPDPRLFHIALAALNAKASESAYIGNKYETDIVGAKAAGLALTILINQSDKDGEAYGSGPKPDSVARDLSEAFKIVSFWEGEGEVPSSRPAENRAGRESPEPKT
jgi:putative hydrolase of the HAD superfamily